MDKGRLELMLGVTARYKKIIHIRNTDDILEVRAISTHYESIVLHTVAGSLSIFHRDIKLAGMFKGCIRLTTTYHDTIIIHDCVPLTQKAIACLTLLDGFPCTMVKSSRGVFGVGRTVEKSSAIQVLENTTDDYLIQNPETEPDVLIKEYLKLAHITV